MFPNVQAAWAWATRNTGDGNVHVDQEIAAGLEILTSEEEDCGMDIPEGEQPVGIDVAGYVAAEEGIDIPAVDIPAVEAGTSIPAAYPWREPGAADRADSYWYARQRTVSYGRSAATLPEGLLSASSSGPVELGATVSPAAAPTVPPAAPAAAAPSGTGVFVPPANWDVRQCDWCEEWTYLRHQACINKDCVS